MAQFPHAPCTPASPYQTLAYAELVRVVIGLLAYAEKHDTYEVEKLAPEALRLLQISQGQLQALIVQNVFLAER